MTNAEKKLLSMAQPIDEKQLEEMYFDSLYIVNSGKRYKGFWGENGYNNIIIIGSVTNNMSHETRFYKISQNEHDKLTIKCNERLDFDIPEDMNCLRIFTIRREYFMVKEVLSDVQLEVVEVVESCKEKTETKNENWCDRSIRRIQPYEARMIREYQDLKDKYEKLKAINVKRECEDEWGIPTGVQWKCPYELLREQQRVMGEYLHILEQRAIVEGLDLKTNLDEVIIDNE